MTADQYSELRELFKSPKKIIITTHKNPDGDAIGSSLGLYHYLKNQHHNVQVIIPNPFPDFLKWMPGQSSIIDFSSEGEKSKELCLDADFIFCLDFNNLERIDELGPVVGNSPAVKILIDHHLQPSAFARFLLSEVSASSTAQLIYDFIVEMSGKGSINSEIGTCLYTGIMTDTGSFRFDSTSSKVHRIIADLIDAGAPNSRIHELIYDVNSLDRLKLIGYCLKEKLYKMPHLPVAYIWLSKTELGLFDHKKGDTEGLVNYALSISGVNVAGLFIEREEGVKISFRSKGDFSVNDLSRLHFNGGGHKNAAGGISYQPVEVTVERFLSVINTYRDSLLREIKY